jgi:hypothetical protein
MSGLDPNNCPCGEEPLAGGGLHLLGAECCSRVAGCVRGFFRPGSGEFEDALQECYLFLAKPGRLEQFRASTEGGRADQFRGWLYTLVKRDCLDQWRTSRRRDELWANASRRLEEPQAPLTPAQAGARECIRVRSQYAVDEVRKARWAHGVDCGRRFELLLDAVFQDRVDYALLSEQLGTTKDAAKTAKYDLVHALTKPFREQTRDELCIEPGLDPEGIEALIDAEIDDLFATAFPRETVPWRDLQAHLDPTPENSAK